MIAKLFENYGMSIRTVYNHELCLDQTKAADIVISVGGDGTFLGTALYVPEKNKPVVGINSNRKSSEGSLCLPQEWDGNLPGVVERLVHKRFNLWQRQRIRIEVSTPLPIFTSLDKACPHIRVYDVPRTYQTSENDPSSTRMQKNKISQMHLLPARALNEVFIGAAMSSRTSDYEIAVDDGPPVRQKSSGLVICTGTGSSSWYYSMNQIGAAFAADLLRLADCCPPGDLEKLAASTAERHNRQLLFPPTEPRMAYCIRDLVINNVFQFGSPRGFACRLKVTSRMDDAFVTIDGRLAFPFEDGATVEFSINPNDDELTVVDL